ATGSYVDLYSECAFEKLPELVAERCQQVLESHQTTHFGDAFVLYSHDEQGVDNLLYVNLNKQLSELDRQLLEIYMQNIGLTFENLNLLLDVR
ncbi:phosphodiesterase, partial [Vibrio vulnificus]